MSARYNKIHFKNIYLVLLFFITVFLSIILSVLMILMNDLLPYSVSKLREYCIFYNPFKGLLVATGFFLVFVVVTVIIFMSGFDDLIVNTDIFLVKERKHKAIFVALISLILFEISPGWLFLIFFYGGVFYAATAYITERRLLKAITEITEDDKEKLEVALEEIKKVDPNFSLPLFYDFAVNVFYKFYTNLSNWEYLNHTLSVYIKSELLDTILKKKKFKEDFKIIDLIITGIDIEPSLIEPKHISIDLFYELFYSKNKKIYKKRAIEIWTFTRDTILSQEPKKMHELSCPICGAPADFTENGICKSCGNKIIQGKHQWYVSKIKQDISYTQPVKQIISLMPEVEEEEFNLVYKTIKSFVKSPQLKQNIEKFEQKYNRVWTEFYENFKHRVVIPFYYALYEAWAEQNWINVRHLVSDKTWQNWNSRLKLFQKNNMKINLNKKIKDIELFEVFLDKYYDTITVRITSEYINYITVNDKIVLGSKKSDIIQEYWTFVRYAGKEQTNFDLYSCPSCGAPIKFMGETGVCQYCGQKVSNGQFYWVVFQILYKKN